MKIIDISAGIYTGMPVHPGDPKVSIRERKKLFNEGFSLSEISMGLHSGTHIDAPAHYISGGKRAHEVRLERLIGRAKVCDMRGVVAIGESEIRECGIKKGDVPLFKTKDACGRFSKDYPALDKTGAEYLIRNKCPSVGTDQFSIEAIGAVGDVHKMLLSKEMIIIEGLDLSDAKPGYYRLFCLPLKILGVEGAPARCILIK